MLAQGCRRLSARSPPMAPFRVHWFSLAAPERLHAISVISYRVAEESDGGRLRLELDQRTLGQFPSWKRPLPPVWILTVSMPESSSLLRRDRRTSPRTSCS